MKYKGNSMSELCAEERTESDGTVMEAIKGIEKKLEKLEEQYTNLNQKLEQQSTNFDNFKEEISGKISSLMKDINKRFASFEKKQKSNSHIDDIIDIIERDKQTQYRIEQLGGRSHLGRKYSYKAPSGSNFHSSSDKRESIGTYD